MNHNRKAFIKGVHEWFADDGNDNLCETGE